MRDNPKINNHLGKVIKCGQNKKTSPVLGPKTDDSKTRTLACHINNNCAKFNRNNTLIFVTG